MGYYRLNRAYDKKSSGAAGLQISTIDAPVSLMLPVIISLIGTIRETILRMIDHIRQCHISTLWSKRFTVCAARFKGIRLRLFRRTINLPADYHICGCV